MPAKQKKEKREIATVNIRVYRSTRDAMSAASRESGKTIARLTDEKFNPHKYAAKA